MEEWNRKQFQLDKAKVKYLQTQILKWVKTNGRNFPWRKKLPWQKALILEILLQRTRAEQVLTIYDQFFERFPNLESLCKSSLDEIMALIKPLGLYKLRAKRLKQVACELKNRKNLPSPEILKSYNGVGNYIANAVHCFHRGKRLPLLDTNFRRVYSRYFGWDLPEDFRRISFFHEIARNILPLRNASWFNYGILDLGAMVCKPKPRCEICPLRNSCSFYNEKRKKMKNS